MLTLLIRIYPTIWSIILSLHNVPLKALIKEWPWVGLGNYQRLIFQDRLFAISLVKTVIYTGVAVTINMFLGLGVAMLLMEKVRFRHFFRMLAFLPAIVPSIINGFVWLWILEPRYGILNYIMDLFNLPRQNWLENPNLALWSLMIGIIWRMTPYAIILLLAGLSSIPEELYEAAMVDGASAIGRFRFITIPLLKPFILIALIGQTLGVAVGEGTMTLLFATTEGGPGYATNLTAWYMWQCAFRWYKLGYGSAISVLIFLATLTLALIYSRFTRRT